MIDARNELPLATARQPGARMLAGAFAILAVLAVLSANQHEWTAAGLCVTAAAALTAALLRPELLVAVWLAATPWASYLLRFPTERSLITFDRVVVPAIAFGLIGRAWRRRGALPAVTLFETAWLCFTVVAALSVLSQSEEKGLALRTTVDAFGLPLLLFYALRVGYDAVRGRRELFVSVLLLAFALPWTGVYEFATANDIMAYKGASILRTGIVRANGPFVTDNSYSIISALVAVFLLWIPALYELRLGARMRVVWRGAQATAYLGALVPMFRTIVGAVAAALAGPYALAGQFRTLARAAAVAVLLLVAAFPAIVPLSRTAVFRDRISDPSSAFSRAATYLAALDIVEDHPLVGVGLTNYHAYFERKYGTAWYIDVEAVANVGAESFPHNNVLGTWAELGTLGVLFYLLAAVALAGYAWRRRAVASLALMAVYWVAGMTLFSGMYSDLNLYYFALVALSLEAPGASRPLP